MTSSPGGPFHSHRHRVKKNLRGEEEETLNLDSIIGINLGFFVQFLDLLSPETWRLSLPAHSEKMLGGNWLG